MTTYQARYEQQILPREKVFRDPVHGYIHIRDNLILQLIDTKEFQRLRRIRQLGTSAYIFHGAEHSRFNHSLGVYEITRRIINNFQRNYPSVEAGDGLWDDNERLVTLCAALLHDIGHGPFSHTFESIFQTNHEAVTQQIITSPETEVHQVLLQMGPDFPNKVASVINKSYPNRQVVQIISSQIDADRMDYLVRDAYYSGVTYGKFDTTRILRVIRPYQGQIVFDFTGMHAVEDYVISRYQMYMQVYFHPVARGMEEVLKNLLARARDYFQQYPSRIASCSEYLAPFLENHWTLADYLKLDDYVLTSYISAWIEEEDTILSDLAYRFINRKPFKSLLTTEATITELTLVIQEELVQMNLDPEYYFGSNSSFDLPYDFYRPNATSQRTQIDLITKMGQIVELSQVSPLVQSFAGEQRGDHRLYYPRELIHQLLETDPELLTENQTKVLLAYQAEINDVTFNIQERLF